MTHTKNQLSYYYTELINNNFDGWFNSNSIDKSFVEIGLINDNNIFEVVKTEKLIKDWSRHNNANNIVTQKKWGTNYPIFSIKIPVIFKLNEFYKNHIKNYIENSINNKFFLKFSFQVLLLNAELYYHKGDVKNIIWNIHNFYDTSL
jgi:hypothetical protein